ncbi:hypothetical protein D3C85_1426000 [compost metagenome]
MDVLRLVRKPVTQVIRDQHMKALLGEEREVQVEIAVTTRAWTTAVQKDQRRALRRGLANFVTMQAIGITHLDEMAHRNRRSRSFWLQGHNRSPQVVMA